MHLYKTLQATLYSVPSFFLYLICILFGLVLGLKDIICWLRHGAHVPPPQG